MGRKGKLNDAQKQVIREKKAAGLGFRKLAKEYGVGVRTVRDVVRGRFTKKQEPVLAVDAAQTQNPAPTEQVVATNE